MYLISYILLATRAARPRVSNRHLLRKTNSSRPSFGASVMFVEQDGSHEPECIHVLGLRVQTSAIGKRTFVCMHRAVHKETTNQHNNITTSTTKSQPAQQYHQRNEIKTKSPTQQHHQHSNITSTTRSPPPATLHTLPTAHSTRHTLYSTLRTLHFTLHTPHSTLYTLHFTLYT